MRVGVIPVEAGRLVGGNCHVVVEALPRRDEGVEHLVLPADWGDVGAVEVKFGYVCALGPLQAGLLLVVASFVSAIFMLAILWLALADATEGRSFVK